MYAKFAYIVVIYRVTQRVDSPQMMNVKDVSSLKCRLKQNVRQLHDAVSSVAVHGLSLCLKGEFRNVAVIKVIKHL